MTVATTFISRGSVSYGHSTDMSLPSDRRSIFGSAKLGSFRDKFSRKSSMGTDAAATAGGAPAPVARNNNPFSNPSPPTRRPRNEAPPSYTEAISAPAPRPVSPAPSHHSALSVASATTPEDPYAFLSSFDTVFLIDDSGSMAGRSWRETRDALRAIAPICTAHDADGIDVCFLNARNPSPGDAPAGGWAGITSADGVAQLFGTVRPGGGTPTGTRIQAILGPYVRRFEAAAAAAGGDADAAAEQIKPVNLIVVTDGVPTDDPESVLAGLARRLDRAGAPPYQVGVQFFQVGNEPGAREALVELDDGLHQESGVRDMVDATTWDAREAGKGVLTGEGILKAVLGAVVKRLDRRAVGGGRATLAP